MSEPGDEEKVLMQHERTMTLEFTLTPENRQAMEIAFDRCFKCVKRIPDCDCHERGYN